MRKEEVDYSSSLAPKHRHEMTQSGHRLSRRRGVPLVHNVEKDETGGRRRRSGREPGRVWQVCGAGASGARVGLYRPRFRLWPMGVGGCAVPAWERDCRRLGMRREGGELQGQRLLRIDIFGRFQSLLISGYGWPRVCHDGDRSNYGEVPKYQRAKDCAPRVPTRAGTIICKVRGPRPHGRAYPRNRPVLSSRQTGSIKKHN